MPRSHRERREAEATRPADAAIDPLEMEGEPEAAAENGDAGLLDLPRFTLSADQVRQELLSIRGLLVP